MIKALGQTEIDRLEILSDKVRMGIPINFIEALEVIEYQATLKKKRQNSIWGRFIEFIKKRYE